MLGLANCASDAHITDYPSERTRLVCNEELTHTTSQPEALLTGVARGVPERIVATARLWVLGHPGARFYFRHRVPRLLSALDGVRRGRTADTASGSPAPRLGVMPPISPNACKDSVSCLTMSA